MSKQYSISLLYFQQGGMHYLALLIICVIILVFPVISAFWQSEKALRSLH
ncbi:hypothetical protein [Dendronalium sp. ChiSLP03b]|nr:hypothetical protein [Dendronalium sp. ChiSLP03b]